MKKINIGFVGAGTVGMGAIKILETKKKDFNSMGIDFEVHKVCVKDKSKERAIPAGCELVTDWKNIVEDSSIDVIVEVMGGTGIATEVVMSALKNNKAVVTANKALIADNFAELLETLARPEAPFFGFEAAVGGGIPMISTFQIQMRADLVTEVSGILNGTTNYMLSKMSAEGMSYEAVLKEAQDLGFAESDPTADVGGYDARSKTVILAQLAYGVLLDENKVFRQGIDRVETIDFEYAQLMGKTIKLLGVSQQTKPGEVTAFVSPMAVPNDKGVGQIHGATNVVSIKSQFQQETLLVGEGAGSLPTGTSIVSDLVRMAKADQSSAFAQPKEQRFTADFESKFYVRFYIEDGVGVVEAVGKAASKNDVSIDSVWQLPIEDKSKLPFVLVTDKCKQTQVEAMCKDLESLSFMRDEPFYLPLI